MVSFVERAKNSLPEKYKDPLRPIYRGLTNVTRRFKERKITRLPKKILSIPSLRFRLEFFHAAQLYLQVNRIDGVYCEFGSHEANTFRMALNTLGQYGRPNKITHFWSFDSFSGMPEPTGIDQQKIWQKGMNFTSEEKFLELTRRDSHRVSTVKGFYSDSLKDFRLPGNQGLALAYIDCDYYSSTCQVLSFLGSYIRHGCLIAFDDWNCYFGDDLRGQRLAFKEFCDREQQRFLFTEFMKINSGGMSFICLERAKVGKDFLG